MRLVRCKKFGLKSLISYGNSLVFPYILAICSLCKNYIVESHSRAADSDGVSFARNNIDTMILVIVVVVGVAYAADLILRIVKIRG